MENCAPGHGKGPWDGIGAVLKRLLKDLETLDKSYNATPFDVFCELVEHFQTSYSKQRDISDRYSISKFNFYYVPGDSKEYNGIQKKALYLQDVLPSIDRVTLAITKLEHIRKNFCFLSEKTFVFW